MFSLFEHESVYMVYDINRWPQIYICKVLRFALVIRWIELRTVCYLSIPSLPGHLMPFPCLWSDHSFRMLHSGHLARKLYVFWYHSFLIRTRISFQTSCKLPLTTRHKLCYILIDLAVLLVVDCIISLLILLIIQERTAALFIWNAFSFPVFLAALLLLQNYAFSQYSTCSDGKYCVCSAFFTWLSTSTCPTHRCMQWKGFFTWLLRKKDMRAGEGHLLLWYNEFDNESDTASSLDLAVWSIITMAHHFLLWILTFLPSGKEVCVVVCIGVCS